LLRDIIYNARGPVFDPRIDPDFLFVWQKDRSVVLMLYGEVSSAGKIFSWSLAWILKTDGNDLYWEHEICDATCSAFRFIS